MNPELGWYQITPIIVVTPYTWEEGGKKGQRRKKRADKEGEAGRRGESAWAGHGATLCTSVHLQPLLAPSPFLGAGHAHCSH